MKIQIITTIGILAAVLTLSAGCSQSKVDDLNTELTSTQAELNRTLNDLADAKKAQREAEEERDTAQAKAETATTNFRQMQAANAGQQRPTDQNTPEEGEPKTTGTKPVTKKERFSYAVGLQIGGDFGNKEIEIDFDRFAAGIQAAYLSRERLMDEKESKQNTRRSLEGLPGA